MGVCRLTEMENDIKIHSFRWNRQSDNWTEFQSGSGAAKQEIDGTLDGKNTPPPPPFTMYSHFSSFSKFANTKNQQTHKINIST